MHVEHPLLSKVCFWVCFYEVNETVTEKMSERKKVFRSVLINGCNYCVLSLLLFFYVRVKKLSQFVLHS